jgi:hypothetical protein
MEKMYQKINHKEIIVNYLLRKYKEKSNTHIAKTLPKPMPLTDQ